MSHGLRAVAAVFGTAARLDRQESALLHLCRVEKHAVDRRCPVEKLEHWHVEHLLDFFLRPVLVTHSITHSGQGGDGRDDQYIKAKVYALCGARVNKPTPA